MRAKTANAKDPNLFPVDKLLAAQEIHGSREKSSTKISDDATFRRVPELSPVID